MVGLGLRSAENYAAAAFICSVLDSESLMEGLLSLQDINVNLVPAMFLFSNKLEEEITKEVLLECHRSQSV